MTIEENFLKAIEKLRDPEKKKKFDQTVDLIINLKGFDAKRDALNIFVELPYKIKDKKIAGFLEKDTKLVDVIKKEDFPRYKEKKDIKKLIKEYDFFIAHAKLMPAIATSFGRVLGPVGKMPSPQLGVLTSEDEKFIKALVEKINMNVRVRAKEPSLKVGIGKESMDDDKIMRNALAVYNKVVESLPKKSENVRNVKIKLTMGKPVNVGL